MCCLSLVCLLIGTFQSLNAQDLGTNKDSLINSIAKISNDKAELPEVTIKAGKNALSYFETPRKTETVAELLQKQSAVTIDALSLFIDKVMYILL